MKTLSKSERPGVTSTEAFKTKTPTSKVKAGRAEATASEPSPSTTVRTEEGVTARREMVRESILSHIGVLRHSPMQDIQNTLDEYERRISGPVPTHVDGSVAARLANPDHSGFAANLLKYVGTSDIILDEEPCAYLSLERWGETTDAVNLAVFEVREETLRRLAVAAAERCVSFGAVLQAIINLGVDTFIREGEESKAQAAAKAKAEAQGEEASAAWVPAKRKAAAKELRARRGITFVPLNPPAVIGLSAAAPAKGKAVRRG